MYLSFFRINTLFWVTGSITGSFRHNGEVYLALAGLLVLVLRHNKTEVWLIKREKTETCLTGHQEVKIER